VQLVVVVPAVLCATGGQTGDLVDACLAGLVRQVDIDQPVVEGRAAAGCGQLKLTPELGATDGAQGVQKLRGDVLAREGRAAEAEREFLEELRLYPDRMDARVSLAALYASLNRRMDARRVVIELVSRQPSPESFLLGMRTFHGTGDREGEVQLRSEARRLFPSDPRFSRRASF